MVYFSLMNLGVYLLLGFPNTYLYFLLQNELNFDVNQDFFRYLLIALGSIIGIACGPLFGYLSDRTSSKLGRRRTWIIVFAPLTAFFFWMISVPFFRDSIMRFGMIIIYIIIIYSAYSVCFNAMNIPYVGLMADITPEDKTIQMSSSFNLIGGIGTALIFFLPSLLLLIFNTYIFACGILAIIFISFCLITFFKIKEPEKEHVVVQTSAKTTYLEVLKDRNFQIFEAAQFFWNFIVAIVMASLASLADNVFGIASELEFGVLGVVLLGIIGVFIAVWNIKGDSLGKKKSLMISLAIMSTVLPFTLIFIFTSTFTLIPIQVQGIIWFIFLAVGYSGLMILPYSILLTIIKKDKEATYIGLNGMFMGISGAFATFLMAILTFSWGAKNSFYIVGPMLGIFGIIAILILRHLMEKKK